MEEIRGKLKGPYKVENDLELYGMIVGEVTVSSGIMLIVHGIITGDLVAEPDSGVKIHGIVNGIVWNRGADVEIYGTVGGVRDSDAERSTKIDQNAVVKE